MAQRGTDVTPVAPSQSGGRRWLSVLLVVLAALAGAAVVVIVTNWSGEPAPRPQPSTSAAPVAGQVPGCSGGDDPVKAVVAALRAPQGSDGAAEAAAAVVRLVESKPFGDPVTGPATVQQIAPSGGAPDLVAQQRGQAPYIAQMTASRARTGRGAFTLTSDPVTPTVTVLVPVEWSTASATHNEWTLLDVQLRREGDRWTVLAAGPALRTPEGLRELRGAAVREGDLDRLGPALDAAGFRRYANGNC